MRLVEAALRASTSIPNSVAGNLSQVLMESVTPLVGSQPRLFGVPTVGGQVQMTHISFDATPGCGKNLIPKGASGAIAGAKV